MLAASDYEGAINTPFNLHTRSCPRSLASISVLAGYASFMETIRREKETLNVPQHRHQEDTGGADETSDMRSSETVFLLLKHS